MTDFNDIRVQVADNTKEFDSRWSEVGGACEFYKNDWNGRLNTWTLKFSLPHNMIHMPIHAAYETESLFQFRRAARLQMPVTSRFHWTYHLHHFYYVC